MMSSKNQITGDWSRTGLAGPTAVLHRGLSWIRQQTVWILFVASLAVQTQRHFWDQPSGGDRANWDYMAQVIARGGVPYRDVVNIKSPLAAYIGAAAIVAARPFRIRDVIAVRIIYILLAGATVAFTFLVARDYFDYRTGLVAAIILMTLSTFTSLTSSGIQPKTPMVLFGLMTLLAIKKNRSITAGFLAMLSALSWQPGLLFLGVAALSSSRFLTELREMKLVKLMLGALIPLATLVAYFQLTGASLDFYRWTIHFNATVYGPEEARSLSDFIEHFSILLSGPLRAARAYFYLAAAGLIIAAAWDFLRTRHPAVRRSSRYGLALSPIVYFAFCMIDIQGKADMLPLLPFVAIFAAFALVFAARREASLATYLWPKATRSAVENAVIALFCVLIAAAGKDALRIDASFPSLQDQDAAAAEILSHMKSGDQIFVHGATEILVLTGLTNASKYFFLDRGKDRYVDQIEPGGFAGWLERLKATRPAVVALSRTDRFERVQDLEDWLIEDYQPRSNGVFSYYLRNDRQPPEQMLHLDE